MQRESFDGESLERETTEGKDPRMPLATSATPDASEIEVWIRTAIASLFELSPNEVNVHKPVAAYGVDSAEAAALAADLEEWAGRAVPLDIAWEWDSTREMAQRVAEHWASSAPTGAPEAQAEQSQA